MTNLGKAHGKYNLANLADEPTWPGWAQPGQVVNQYPVRRVQEDSLGITTPLGGVRWGPPPPICTVHFGDLRHACPKVTPHPLYIYGPGGVGGGG